MKALLILALVMSLGGCPDHRPDRRHGPPKLPTPSVSASEKG